MENNSGESATVSTKQWKKWQIVIISGRFSVKNLFKIKSSFDEAGKMSLPFVAIDLNTTTYLDSSAITILLNFHRRCSEKGGRMVIFGLNPDIKEIISIVGIDKIITMVKTINDLP